MGVSTGKPAPRAGVLIVVDGPAAVRRLIAYVIRMVGRRRAVRFCVVHLTPRASITVRGTAARAFDHTRAALRRAGIAALALDTQFLGPSDQHRPAERLLELARANCCDTVVVERPEIWPDHARAHAVLVDNLLRAGTGVTVWLVG